MSTHILHRVCQAVELWLESQDFESEPNIYKGAEHATVVEGEQPNMELPAVTVRAMRASQDPPFSNNWIVDVEVAVRTNADDETDTAHSDIADEVFDSLYTDSIASDLSGMLSNFTVSLMVPGEQTFEVVERSWVSTFMFGLHCCNADIV